MAEAGGRRIKRSLVIKSGSVSFCDTDLISKFKEFGLIRSYIETKVEEINTFNQAGNYNKTYLINGRQLTNIGVFRVYAESYIASLKTIHPDLTRMVYQTEGNEFGIPIQIYCFTKTTEWGEYENVQSDIFDHLYAAAPQFGLEIFQHPSGADFNKLIH